MDSLGTNIQYWNQYQGMSESTRDEWLQGVFNGSISTLESQIKSNWTQMVGSYNAMVKNQKPTSNFADVRLTPGIYKPIIEFNISDNAASDFTVENIKRALVNAPLASQEHGYAASTGKTTVNMLIDDEQRYSNGYKRKGWTSN